MAKRIPQNTIEEIQKLRSQGWSLPELAKKFEIGRGTVWRHIQGVKILPQYQELWAAKRISSVRRKNLAETKAKEKATNLVNNLTTRERILILASLYWAEGGKGDFNITNTDPDLIKVFVRGLVSNLGIERNRLRLNIRVYEDMNHESCINFWLKTTGLNRESITNVNVLYGKKKGKLKYGMCRLRVLKGGDMLKYMVALRGRIVEHFAPVVQWTERRFPKP